MKKSFLIVGAIALFVTLFMVSCEKEDEKTGNATGGSEVSDTIPQDPQPVNPTDTIAPPDTIAPLDTNRICLKGTTWFLRFVSDEPQFNHQDITDYYWCFETDTTMVVKAHLIEWEGDSIDYTDQYTAPYFFDGIEGYFVTPVGYVVDFMYSHEEKALVREDDGGYRWVFRQIE